MAKKLSPNDSDIAINLSFAQNMRVDKIEILVLGGTWDHYNFEYRKYFITSLYHGINTLNNRNVDIDLF